MGSDRLFIVSGVLVSAITLFSFILKNSQPDVEGLIKSGRYWKATCVLKEVNIPTGFFHGEMNRLDCEGVVTNVSTKKYNQAPSAYQDSLRNKVR